MLTQTGVMLWRGALIATTVTLAMLPWFAGLLVVGPVLARACVVARLPRGGGRRDAGDGGLRVPNPR